MEHTSNRGDKLTTTEIYNKRNSNEHSLLKQGFHQNKNQLAALMMYAISI
jgi:hypothetical protein